MGDPDLFTARGQGRVGGENYASCKVQDQGRHYGGTGGLSPPSSGKLAPRCEIRDLLSHTSYFLKFVDQLLSLGNERLHDLMIGSHRARASKLNLDYVLQDLIQNFPFVKFSRHGFTLLRRQAYTFDFLAV